MVNAEAMVPNRLAAPPNTTTIKVSTIYKEPNVGPVDAMVVNAAPAIPAIPQPSAKVNRSTCLVLIPTAPLITRFCVVARTFNPQLERYISKNTPRVTNAVRPNTNMPLIGINIVSVGIQDPINQSGKAGLTSRAPKIERNDCCIIRLSPQVASKVSRGRL